MISLALSLSLSFLSLIDLFLISLSLSLSHPFREAKHAEITVVTAVMGSQAPSYLPDVSASRMMSRYLEGGYLAEEEVKKMVPSLATARSLM